MIQKKYDELRKKLTSVIDGEESFIANFSNATALIQEEFNHHWVGFYFLDKKNNNLMLGPFQGPLACTRIPFDKGVCGKAWSSKKTQLVANVHEFPGHIACSSATNSEIVIPIFKGKEFFGVLDIDSIHFDHFNELDKLGLESLCQVLSESLSDQM